MHWIFVLANFFLKTSHVYNPYVTKTVGEFIFDGYDDPLLDVVAKLKKFFPIDLPFKKVGWFYGVISNCLYLSMIRVFILRIYR